MLTRSRALALRAVGVTVSGLAVACGGHSAAATPVPASAATISAPSSPRPIPAWIDPSLRGTLLLTDEAGWPKRWEGGPFRYCFDASVTRQRAMLEAVADRMTAISGIPRTAAGACNVTWKVAADPYIEVPVGSAQSRLFGTETSILKAEITFRFEDFVRGPDALHEGGHVLGLGHSPRPCDLMHNGTCKGDDFTADELAVLAWIYDRPSTK